MSTYSKYPAACSTNRFNTTAPKAKLGATITPMPLSFASASNRARSSSVNPLAPRTKCVEEAAPSRAASIHAEALVKSTSTSGLVSSRRDSRFVDKLTSDPPGNANTGPRSR